jgi:hypothetical protein
MINQKQLENVEYLNYLGSVVSNDASCTCDIKIQDCCNESCIEKEENSFYQQIGLKFKDEMSEVLYLELRIVWC